MSDVSKGLALFHKVHWKPFEYCIVIPFDQLRALSTVCSQGFVDTVAGGSLYTYLTVAKNCTFIVLRWTLLVKSTTFSMQSFV